MFLYIIPLALTILIESLVIYLLGFRKKHLYFALLIVNILTNPLLNYLVSKYLLDFYAVLVLEIVVVFIEALLLKILVKDNLPFLSLSFIMNAVSFLIGIWLPWRIIWEIFL